MSREITDSSNPIRSANESPISKNLRRIAGIVRVYGGSTWDTGPEKSTLLPSRRDWRNFSLFRIRSVPGDESSGFDTICMLPVGIQYLRDR